MVSHNVSYATNWKKDRRSMVDAAPQMARSATVPKSARNPTSRLPQFLRPKPPLKARNWLLLWNHGQKR